jgi:hypothetical protein
MILYRVHKSPASTALALAALQVAPHAAPAAAAALHKLALRLTKAHMMRPGEDEYSLHPHLDKRQDWLPPSFGSEERVHSR